MKELIKCLVVDDERIARQIVVNYLSKLPHFTLVGECANALDTLKVLQTQSVDVLILDIQMPDLSGVELLRSLPQSPLVIFTTAYSNYALEGYELNIVDYLLKPFRFERFLQALNKAAERLRSRNSVPPESFASPCAAPDYLQVRADHKIYKVAFDNIAFIQSMKEYVAFHLLSGGKILALMSLRQLEGDLPANRFLRIHRSYIVPVSRVTALNAQHVLLGKTKLPVGGSYRDIVKTKLLS